MKLFKRGFVGVGLSALFLVGIFFSWPQKSLALSWEQVGVSGLGGGAGNSTSVRMVNFNDKLYTSIGNYDLPPDGVRIFSSADGQIWIQVNDDGFGSAANMDP